VTGAEAAMGSGRRGGPVAGVANESKTHATRQKGMPASAPENGHEKGRPEAAFSNRSVSSLARAPDQKK